MTASPWRPTSRRSAARAADGRSIGDLRRDDAVRTLRTLRIPTGMVLPGHADVRRRHGDRAADAGRRRRTRPVPGRAGRDPARHVAARRHHAEARSSRWSTSAAAARCVARQRPVARPSDAPAPEHARDGQGTLVEPARRHAAGPPGRTLGADAWAARSARTGRSSRRAATTGRRACGTPGPAPSSRRSRATTAGSGRRRSRTLDGRLTLHTDEPRRHDDDAGTCQDRDASASRSTPGRARTPCPYPSEAEPHVAVSPDGRLLATNDVDGISILDAATHAVVRTIKATQPDGSFDATWSPDGTPAGGHGHRDGDRRALRHGDLAARRARTAGRWPGPLADRPAWSDEIDPNESHRDREAAQRRARGRVLAGLGGARRGSRRRHGLDVGRAGPAHPIGRPAAARRARPRPGVQPGVERARGRLRVTPSAGGVAVFAPGEATPRYTVNVDDGYGRPEAVAFSPDGTVLATGGGTGDVRFWDATTGTEISPRVVTSAGWVLDLAWTPVGQDAGQLRDGRDRPADRRRPRRPSPAFCPARERLGRCDAVAGRLPPVRRLRERPGASTGRSIPPSGPRMPARSPVAP